jgi:NADPH:quinone reductase-like Zn-dependent oxidoreductase
MRQTSACSLFAVQTSTFKCVVSSFTASACVCCLLRACTADALDKCLSVLKPGGHYSHIQNLGTDPDVMQWLRQQHEAGKGPGVSHIFVTPNAGQLGEVLQMMAAGKVKLEVAKVRTSAAV